MAVVSSCCKMFGSVHLTSATFICCLAFWLYKNCIELYMGKIRKGKMTSSPYGPYEMGYTRATMEKAKSDNIL